jgi:hypothetical protein
MSDESDRDENQSNIKFSIGIGGDSYDHLGHGHHSHGLDIETPPLQFMTLGQKIGIVVVVLFIVAFALFKIAPGLFGME